MIFEELGFITVVNGSLFTGVHPIGTHNGGGHFVHDGDLKTCLLLLSLLTTLQKDMETKNDLKTTHLNFVFLTFQVLIENGTVE